MVAAYNMIFYSLSFFSPTESKNPRGFWAHSKNNRKLIILTMVFIKGLVEKWLFTVTVHGLLELKLQMEISSM